METPVARAFDAIILDLDGVITNTAALHAEAWKKLFDLFNEERAAKGLSRFAPFDSQSDYRAYVDGKLRQDGIRSFLQSRDITLSKHETAVLGEKKDQFYLTLLNERGPGAYHDAVETLRKWKKDGLKLGLVSSSKNAKSVLNVAGISEFFNVVIDGNDLERSGIEGKPAPGIFLAAAEALQVQPKRAIVLEDAVSGIEAARHGGFGKIIGIARETPGDDLLTAGADLVVRSFYEISLKESS